MSDTIKFRNLLHVGIWLAEAVGKRNGDRDIPISAVVNRASAAFFVADNKPTQMIYDVWVTQNCARYLTFGVHWQCMPDGTDDRRVRLIDGADGIEVDTQRMELLADAITGVIWGAL